MSDIKIKCVDQTLTFVNAPVIASGGVIEDRVVFDFCPLWNGYVKTAVFYRDKTEVYYKLLEADDSCDIPAEVLASSGIVYIGVFGVKDESRRTSELLAYSISEGAVLNIAPTVDVYAQILEALANTKIVSGRITEKGHLVFTKQDGSEVDVGSGISLTDEQVNTALTEWLEINAEQTQLTTINAAFITKIREMHKKGLIRFWVGTKAEYEAITPADNVFYVITDEDPLTDVIKEVEQNAQEIGAIANDVSSLETTVNSLKNVKGSTLSTTTTDITVKRTNSTGNTTEAATWYLHKFDDGVLEAWANVEVNKVDCNTAIGSGYGLDGWYRSGLQAVTVAYPSDFSNIDFVNIENPFPYCVGSSMGKYQYITALSSSKSASATVYSSTSADNTAVQFGLKLTGRWK